MIGKKYFCLLAFGAFSLLAKAENSDWRKIENSLYTLELPGSWIPMPGMPGDGTKPGERDARGYHLHYLAWQTPVKSKEEIPYCIGVDIQTYQKLDKTPLSVRDIEKAVIIPISPNRNEICSLKNELRLLVLKDSREMDGSIIKYRIYYLLKEAGRGVHCVEISLRNELLKEKPETEKVIERILNSFTVKGGIE